MSGTYYGKKNVNTCFLYQLYPEMIIFWAYWVKWIMLKLVLPASFSFKMWLENLKLHFGFMLFLLGRTTLETSTDFRNAFSSWAPSLLLCSTNSHYLSLPKFQCLSLLLAECIIFCLASHSCTALWTLHTECIGDTFFLRYHSAQLLGVQCF